MSLETPDHQPSLYNDAIAYDVLHAPGTAKEVAGLREIRAQYAAGTPESWLEPACGTGRFVRLLARQGERVIGFDRSADAVWYCRDRLRRGGKRAADLAEVSVAEMAGFKPPRRRVGVAFNTINTIRHLGSDEDLLRHFELIAASLDPAGLYAVGLSLTAYGLEPPTEDVWKAARGRLRVTQVVNYLPPEGDGSREAGRGRAEQVYSHVTVERPSGTQEIVDRYALRTYSRAQWVGVLERSALRLEWVTDERGVPMDLPESGYRMYLLRPR